MTNGNDTRPSSGFSISRATRVVERFGPAITGALCGIFVFGRLAKANIGVLDSVGITLAMIRFGLIGFHLGIDFPPLPSRASRIGIADLGFSPKVDLTKLLSAAGTFVTVAAALVSVYVAMFDQALPAKWMMVVGVCWLFGVTMQIVAGIRARMKLALQKIGWQVPDHSDNGSGTAARPHVPARNGLPGSISA